MKNRFLTLFLLCAAAFQVQAFDDRFTNIGKLADNIGGDELAELLAEASLDARYQPERAETTSADLEVARFANNTSVSPSGIGMVRFLSGSSSPKPAASPEALGGLKLTGSLYGGRASSGSTSISVDPAGFSPTGANLAGARTPGVSRENDSRLRERFRRIREARGQNPVASVPATRTTPRTITAVREAAQAQLEAARLEDELDREFAADIRTASTSSLANTAPSPLDGPITLSALGALQPRLSPGFDSPRRDQLPAGAGARTRRTTPSPLSTAASAAAVPMHPLLAATGGVPGGSPAPERKSLSNRLGLPLRSTRSATGTATTPRSGSSDLSSMAADAVRKTHARKAPRPKSRLSRSSSTTPTTPSPTEPTGFLQAPSSADRLGNIVTSNGVSLPRLKLPSSIQE